MMTIRESVYDKRKTLLPERQQGQSYLLNHLPCGIFTALTDDDFTIVYGNENFYHLTEFSEEASKEKKSESLRLFLWHEDYDSFVDLFHYKTRKNEFTLELSARIRKVSKEITWLLLRCTYVPDEHMIYGVALDITEKKKVMDELRVSEQENRIAIMQSDKIICRYYPDSRTLIFPEDAAERWGKETVCKNAPESSIASGLIAQCSIEEYRNFYGQIMSGKSSGSCTVKMYQYENQAFRWVRGDYTLVSGEGEPISAVISFYDCTELHEKEIAYERWRQMFLVQKRDCIGYYEYNLADDVFEISEGNVDMEVPMEFIGSYSSMVQYVANHYVVAKDRMRYLSTLNRERLLGQFYEGRTEVECEHRRYRRNGPAFWVRSQIQMIMDPFANAVKIFILTKDIDKEKCQALRMKKMSQSDPLTGLYNRAVITEKIDFVLKHSKERDNHAFIILDIDHFKMLNDSRGHQFGDKVLKETAECLRSSLREEDICGRLGGDEFVIFMKNIGKDADLLERLNDLKSRMEKIYGNNMTMTGSLGVSKYPQDGRNFQTLYKKSDMALYDAKKSGRNRVSIYRRKGRNENHD